MFKSMLGMNMAVAVWFGGQQEALALGQSLAHCVRSILGVEAESPWLTYLGFLATQLLHINAMHLLLNVFGLVVMFWGFLPIVRMSCLLGFLGFAWLGVAAYLTFIEPLQWYVGLSGAIHGVFVAGLVLLWHRLMVAKPLRSKVIVAVALLLTVGLLAKLALEWFDVSLSHSQLVGPVAVAGHRGGVLAGLCLGLLCSLGLRLKWFGLHTIFSQTQP